VTPARLRPSGAAIVPELCGWPQFSARRHAGEPEMNGGFRFRSGGLGLSAGTRVHSNVELEMKRTILIAMSLALSSAAFVTSADANWRTNHPRRAEVNARLNNQARRIHAERKEGELTAGQATDLRAEDRGIRAQERFDASHDGGHITKAEQVQLNHEENGVSRQIGR
jgi:hypothetical protein